MVRLDLFTYGFIFSWMQRECCAKANFVRHMPCIARLVHVKAMREWGSLNLKTVQLQFSLSSLIC